MTLDETLRERSNLNSPALPALNRLVAPVGRILRRWPDVVAEPPERDRDVLVAEMRDRIAQNRWDGARMSFVTRAARALFETERRDRADLADLCRFYCEEIRASTKASFINAMFAVHIASYQPGAPHTRSLASALDAANARLGESRRALLKLVPEILDVTQAPSALARLMINMGDPWVDLKAIGVNAPHGPGLMQHAHLAYVVLLRPALKTRAGLERLFSWIRPTGREPLRSGAAQVITSARSLAN